MLGAIVDTAGSVILGLYPDHRIFAWNRAAEALYQTPRERALGMDYVANFLAPEHRAAVAADIQEVLAGKRTLNFEDDSILPDGSRRTLIWNVARVLDAAGVPVGIVATGQDITERKEADERFRLIFECAQDGMLLSDASGVIDCNPAALRMLGLTDRSELIGRRPAEFSPPLQPDGAASDEKSRRLGSITLASGSHTFEWVHARPDGTEVPVEVSVQHAMLDGRRVSIVVWRDQSKRLEIERARAEVEHRLRLAHKLEAVSQLAGGVAHDFNNLLAAIQNSIALSLHEVPAEFPIRADLELALETTQRAAGLTGQLLAFSRRQPRDTECVDLAALVKGMVPLFRTSLPPSVDISLDLTDAGACVEADRSQLEQVMLNLVLNSRDAMPDGGTLTITARTIDDGRQAALTVSDSGTGMSAAMCERVFEPFFSTKPIGTGTGLGLAVVYGVVTQAGGTIRVESTPGEGTTMHILLPARPASAATPIVTDPQPSSAPISVLLVDDDAAVRSTTRRLLQRLKFTVLEAQNGREALRTFEEQHAAIDVVLSDIRMPEMDGVQLALAIRRIVADFPIVFLSGFDAIGRDHVVGLGTVPLLAKPCTADALATVLRAAVDAGRRAQP